MKLWKVETASGPVYVQAPNEEQAFAYAEAQYGKGNVTGVTAARNSGEPGIGTPILAQTDAGIQRVGTYGEGGNLNSLNNFAEAMGGTDFGNNLAQNPYYSISSTKVQMSPLTDGKGGDGVEAFGGMGFDTDTIADQQNLPSVFRNFLTSIGMNPRQGAGPVAQQLASPLQSILGMAGGGQVNLNTGAVGEGSGFEAQGAGDFLRARGLSGIGDAGATIVKALSGYGMTNEGTEGYLDPDSYKSDKSIDTANALLAAMFSQAPGYASRYGRSSIESAMNKYFDQRAGGTLGQGAIGGADYTNIGGQETDPNIMRYVMNKFGSGIFG